MTRWRPYLSGERTSFTYYPNSAAVGLGAMVEIRGQSFSILAEVTTKPAAQGVIFKQRWRARRARAVHRRTRRRRAQRRRNPSRHIRSGRGQSVHRTQRRLGGVLGLPGALPVYRRHHRPGGGRYLRGGLRKPGEEALHRLRERLGGPLAELFPLAERRLGGGLDHDVPGRCGPGVVLVDREAARAVLGGRAVPDVDGPGDGGLGDLGAALGGGLVPAHAGVLAVDTPPDAHERDATRWCGFGAATT